MANGFNQIILRGNVTHDFELRETSNGNPVVNFSMAINEYFKKDSEPTYMKIVAYKSNALTCSKFLKKGDPVMVVGRISNNKWTDKDGITRTNSEVIANFVQLHGYSKGYGSQLIA